MRACLGTSSFPHPLPHHLSFHRAADPSLLLLGRDGTDAGFQRSRLDNAAGGNRKQEERTSVPFVCGKADAQGEAAIRKVYEPLLSTPIRPPVFDL